MTIRAALAGAVAAAVWGVAEPLWQRPLGTSYSDVGVLRPLVPWPRAVHVVNGALFGVAYDELSRRTGRSGAGFGIAVALAENVTLWPIVALVDRKHATDARAFASGCVGHAVFGGLLGALTAKN